MRKYALRGRGIQCGEYLASTNIRIIKLLRMENDPDVKKDLDAPGNTLTWSTLKNPVVATRVFADVTQVFLYFRYRV